MSQDVINNLKDILQRVGIDTNESFLESMIDQACSSEFAQPNLALNLDICEMINKKRGTMSRDAAFHILRYINRSTAPSAQLALTLLDNCVKNCGYPFHLVISSKEFLNEIVRRFPETPRNLSSAQLRILEMIQEWNVALCEHSRYKNDFKHINDMYRLLQYKGYRFPSIDESSLAQYTGQQGLKTEDELEEQDRAAQGAKLDALLRKGTPAALAEANDLMKVMSGYDTSKQPDYKQEVNNELDQIESKIILFNDMLNQKEPRFLKDSAIEDLKSFAKNSSVKLQNFIANNPEEDRLGRLLELNDLINTVIQKYDDLKSGKQIKNLAIDRKPDSSTTSGVKQQAAISLIDFDDGSMGNSSVKNSPSSVKDQLIDIFGGSSQTVGSLTNPSITPLPQNNHVDLFAQQNLMQDPKPKVVQQVRQATTQSVDLMNNDLLGFNPAPQNMISDSKQTLLDFSNDLNINTKAVPPISKEFLIFNKNGLQIKLQVQTPKTFDMYTLRAIFINVTPATFSDLNFQIAVPKV